MKILISGAGFAGLTLAYWLKQAGFQPVIIEKAAAFQRRGYLLGLHHSSVLILQKMGLMGRVVERAIDTMRYQLIDSRGKPINTGTYLSYKQDQRGKLPVHRADLQLTLYEAVRDDVELRFGTTITTLHETPTGADVTFSDSSTQTFDLVVGADGIHSTVRRLRFGVGYEQPLGATYCAFISPKTTPHTPSYVQIASGIMSILYDLNADEFGGIFVIKGQTPGAWKDALVQRHLPSGGSVLELLQQIPDDTYIFTDQLMQVILPRWYQGRTVLVGDAAYALSAASGFGGTAAIVGAYVLARELAASGLEGLAAYDRQLRKVIEKRQRDARQTLQQICSTHPLAITARDTLLRLIPEGMYRLAGNRDDFEPMTQ
jgi:2-polyprenyl-6-methoxyphenol hydroxylase-like FAD-dependent oxidoreductase